MSKKLKRLVVTLDEADPAKGYQRVSIVKNPAIQSGFVALSAAPAQAAKLIHLSTEPQKQVLTGPALIPDQVILRLDAEKNPYEIVFTPDVIEKIGRKLMAEGLTRESNDEHSVELTGNTITELWYVADPANDKAAALGLDVPAGTLMMSLHVPDTDYWEKEIVTGNRTGFSIEGLFDFEEIKLSAQAAKPSFMAKNFLKILLGMARTANIKLSQVELEDGRFVDVKDDGTVFLLKDDGEDGEALADGEYKTADGGTLTVKDAKATLTPAPADVKNADNTGDNSSATGNADAVKKAQEALAGVADETDAAKLETQLKKALEALGVTQLSAVEVKLEAVDMADGSQMLLNPITRRLTYADGKMVETGYYACKDGSYFKVNTEQYTYQIDKDTYDRSVKLSSVEAELTKLQQENASTSSTERLKLSNDNVKLSAEEVAKLPRALQLTAQLRGD